MDTLAEDSWVEDEDEDAVLLHPSMGASSDADAQKGAPDPTWLPPAYIILHECDDAACSTEDGAVQEADEDGACDGFCLAGFASYVGAASTRLNHNEPDGGWGYTSCCGQRAHFDCLGRWLKPDDPEQGSLVESSGGMVRMELKCPFCRTAMSRSSKRMMTAVPRKSSRTYSQDS